MSNYESDLIFDTSIATKNLGDYIIMESIKNELRKMFPEDFFLYIPTHDDVGNSSYKLAKNINYTFLGGTNLLTDHYFGKSHSQWHFGLKDSFKIRKIICMAAGWQSYKDYSKLRYRPFTSMQKIIYNQSLSKNAIHSVRDSYTLKKMTEMGFEAINTSCVTMWELNEEHLNKIPSTKADSVITTITDYCNSEFHLKMYKKMIEYLMSLYKDVFIWIQSPEDIQILNKISVAGIENLKIIPPVLSNYDMVLKNKNIDYVGTRLHAGIRALQFKKRTIVVEMDNRAREIALDTNLKTLNYKDIEYLPKLVKKSFPMDIRVPLSNIEKWKNQFLQ